MSRAGAPAVGAAPAGGRSAAVAGLRRTVGRWATVLVAVGVVMLMQPFAIQLFTWSFVTILAGTVMFIVVSHFPE